MLLDFYWKYLPSEGQFSMPTLVLRAVSGVSLFADFGRFLIKENYWFAAMFLLASTAFAQNYPYTYRIVSR